MGWKSSDVVRFELEQKIKALSRHLKVYEAHEQYPMGFLN